MEFWKLFAAGALIVFILLGLVIWLKDGNDRTGGGR